VAITQIEFHLINDLLRAGVIPAGPRVLELGQANWYRDVPMTALEAAVTEFATDDARRARSLDAIRKEFQSQGPRWVFNLATLYYRAVLNPRERVAIDLHGPPAALSLDLNQPVDLQGRRFDLLMNLGTAEHVFDVAQVFRTAHNLTAPGGVMIHGMPFQGFVDHGFYSFNPTFYFDIAAANGYRVDRVRYATLAPYTARDLTDRDALASRAAVPIGENALLFAVFIKAGADAPFQVPRQGYYDDTVSHDARAAWHQNR